MQEVISSSSGVLIWLSDKLQFVDFVEFAPDQRDKLKVCRTIEFRSRWTRSSLRNHRNGHVRGVAFRSKNVLRCRLVV
jgi:hypothetical protein